MKVSYGIAEAGRQWQKTLQNWIVTDAKLERVYEISQLFLKRDATGRVVLLVPNVTEDFLLAGKPEKIGQFMSVLRKRFRVGKVIIDDRFFFDGCEVLQDNICIVDMSMHRYLERINEIHLTRERGK